MERRNYDLQIFTLVGTDRWIALLNHVNLHVYREQLGLRRLHEIDDRASFHD